MSGTFVVAVDVGTASARAGVLDGSGATLARAECPILMNVPAAGHAEHDSEDIWSAVCEAVRAACRLAKVQPGAVAAIGFDATCSLVARGPAGEQVSVSTTGERRWDTIAWLDHRAIDEAEACTATRHRVIDHAGGVMSPEMATPKLAWLKRHRPAEWRSIGHLFDLADFLTWKASGSTARSQCTLTCKWTFMAHESEGWQRDYLALIGLDDLAERGGLPEAATPVGADIGPLTEAAARQLGLTAACRVASGMIDAHAGALGALAAYAGRPEEIDSHLALIAGTSSCVTTLSSAPLMMRGLWGPYFGAGLPGLWLSEGGQSATGALLDHIIATHGNGLVADGEAHRRICERIAVLRAEHGEAFAGRLHVLPDFHGNRSPFGDPHMRGVVSGLTLDASFDALCRLYYRTAVAIALGVRQILEAMAGAGRSIGTLHVAGGHTRNPVLMKLYADATGCDVVVTDAPDAMLLGTAILAASAAGWHGSVAACATAFARPSTVRRPDWSQRNAFDRDYAIFRRMQEDREALEVLEKGWASDVERPLKLPVMR